MERYPAMLALCRDINTYNWSKLESTLSFLDETRSKKYLNILIKDFYAQQYYFNTTKTLPDSAFAEMNMNNHYQLKGMLLSRYKTMFKDLTQLGDSSINNLIEEYRTAHSLLSKQVSKPVNERKYRIDSLQNIVNEKEALLTKEYARADNTKKKKFNWKEVRDQLSLNEFVAEFSSFTYRLKYDQPRISFYVAYVFSKNDSLPRTVYLFNEMELNKILEQKSPSTLYASRGSSGKSITNKTSKELYNLIWKPIEKVIPEGSTIYYSPSGKLNQIAFAALPDSSGQLILEKYNLNQYSNTSTAFNNNIEVESSPTIFIGGIIYDYEPSEDNNPKIQPKTEVLNLKINRSTNNGVWQYLPGTEKEVNDLYKLYASVNKKSIVVDGEEATESWFKNLSGNSPKVLHIASHGFFIENSTKRENTLYNKTPIYTLSEDPLLRSGLVLAHGNYTWVNGSNPYTQEDGILTAYEIASLDFQNTDLVVLSACETGLGGIEGSEGVYGLQRAFKMAGVKYIIMSLWEVPDKETAEYMNLFYESWLTDNNLRRAFLETQKVMAKKYKDEPEKWAAFVLIE